MPVEIPNPVAFDKDTANASYDAAAVTRFWRALQSADAVFKEFRGGFIGKSSPVHFFWGSFDPRRHALLRPPGHGPCPRPTASRAKATSHEVSSVGWWPGDETTPFPRLSTPIPRPNRWASRRLR